MTIAAGAALGQQPADDAQGVARPRTAERVVRVFDFEERLANPLDIPQGWVRAQHDELVPRVRPGFPIWNEAELDYTVAHGGEGSVRLSVAGGSASLRLEPGVAPIFPLGEYAVRAMVRTEGLRQARPRVVVRALDPRGGPIAGSERAAVLEQPSGDWLPIEVRLPGLYRDAAFLQIDLELVQPREFASAVLGEHQVWEDDFQGSVWFDDVVVVQLPQVAISTGSPLNLVTRPERPALRLEVRDLAAEDLLASVRVYDARRRLVASADREISEGRAEWTWAPELRELGWYRAVIDVSAGGLLVASESCDLAWLDEPAAGGPSYAAGEGPRADETAPASQDRSMFVELTRLPPGSADEIATALRAIGVSSASLPVWDSALRPEDLSARVEMVRELAVAAREAWIDISFGLPVAPAALASGLRIEPADVLGVIGREDGAWEPYLLDALDRLGTVSSGWQLGASGDGSVARRPALAGDVAAARATLGTLVPGVEISLGTRLDAPAGAIVGSGADGAHVEWPSWMPTAPMGVAGAPWRDAESFAARFVLEPLSAEGHTERAVAADLARRTVELWCVATESESSRGSAGLRDPWRIEAGERPVAHPMPTLAAWRSLADRLAGRAFAVEWPLAKGVRCVVFAPSPGQPGRGGVIAAWNETAAPEEAELVATLGPDPVRVYDIFGNSWVVEPTSSDDGSRREHRIALGPEPVFIEGFNTGLVLFLTSVGLDPPEIHSVAGEHEHAVRLRNPWNVPAMGELVVTEPGGYDPARQARDRTWEVTPRTMSFDLAPGEEASLPVVLSFSRATEAGGTIFVFDVRVAADQNYGWVRARSFVQLTWRDVWVDLTVRPAERGRGEDLIVEATITNTGEVARTFEAVAAAPGVARVRASIGTLEPGQSAVRRFPFPSAYDALAGERVIVSLSEPDGPGRLTKSLEVPE